jgi:hypothetical protein
MSGNSDVPVLTWRNIDHVTRHWRLEAANVVIGQRVPGMGRSILNESAVSSIGAMRIVRVGPVISAIQDVMLTCAE